MIGNKIFKNNKGVTLMELVVSVGIFIVIMLAATGIFRMVIEGQRNAIAGQNVQENMRYAFEIMSKEIRMAQPNDNSIYAYCMGRPGNFAHPNNVFNNNSADITVIFFINNSGACTTYELEASTGRLKVTRDAATDYLTPAKIKISNLKFQVTDNLLGVSTIQPKVRILMDASMSAGKEYHKQDMKLQTTISSRVY